MDKYKTDCLYYTGERPCIYDIHCEECLKYNPRGKKILVIATGGIIETLQLTTLFEGIKNHYDKSFVSVLIQQENEWILNNNNLIDEVIIYDYSNIFYLLARKFELVINHGGSYIGASVMSLVNADEKLGFGLSKEGNIVPLNKRTDDLFQTRIISKKRRDNIKSIPNLLYDSSRISFKNQDYFLKLNEEDRVDAEKYLRAKGIVLKKPSIAISVLGTGGNPPLMIPNENINMLSNRLEEEGITAVVLSDDLFQLRKKNVSKNRFRAGVLSLFDIIVTGNTLDMHLAIALKLKVIGLFGPTPHQEISLYGRGTKIVSDMDCSPCLKDKECTNYNNNCMKKINIQGLIKIIKKHIKI